MKDRASSDAHPREKILHRFHHNEENCIIREGLERISLYDISRISRSMISQVPDSLDGTIVGLSLRSPTFILASLIFAWTKGAIPLLLDPDSPADRIRVRELNASAEFISDDQEHNQDGDLVHFPVPMSAEPLSTDDLRLPGENDPLVGFFTSGTTGTPKIVLKNGYQFYRQLQSVPGIFNFPQPPVVTSLVPMYHILGFFYGLMLPLTLGGSTRNASSLLPAAARDSLIEEQPDLVAGTSVNYRILLEAWSSAGTCSTTRFISSGSPLDQSVAEHFAELAGSQILEMYGSTETGGCAHRFGRETWQPYPGVEFRINDLEQLEILSPWSEHPESWVVTHDLAEVDGHGFRLLGRDGSLVKIGGKRFTTVEVEKTIKTHPSVQDAAVLVYRRQSNEPAIQAFVEQKAGHSLTAASLRTFLVTELAAFKIPRTITMSEALPRNRLNKINYAELRNHIGREDG